MTRIVVVCCVLLLGCPSGDPCGELVLDPATESCVCPMGFLPRPELGICEGPDGSVVRYDGGLTDPEDASLDVMDAGSDSCSGDTCACEDGAVRPCVGGTDVGSCVVGEQACDEGIWGACRGAVGPRAETCDGVDEDCDGTPDNGSASASCGAVSRAVETGCSGGACFVAECAGGYLDCDGMFDNGCEAQLGTVTACLSCGDVCGWDCEAAGCNDAIELSLGTRHSCALRENRSFACWGEGSIVPVEIEGPRFVTIDSGAERTCGVTEGAGIACGSTRELLEGTATTTNVASVGGVAEQVSVGLDHACAVLSDGQVRCWGANTYYQLGVTGGARTTPVTSIRDASEVRAGSEFSCARLRSGTVRCWGANYFGNLGNGRTDLASLPVDVSGLTGVTSLSIGAQSLHACALRSDRTVWCWGSNSDGQLGVGDIENRSTPVQVMGLTDAVQVSAGFQHSCALRASGTVVCWGNGSDGRLGNGTSVRQPRPVTATVSDAVAVFAGYSHTCALRADGGVACWGDNEFGQLGDGSTRDSSAPTPVRAP